MYNSVTFGTGEVYKGHTEGFIHLFTYLKNWFGKQCFITNEELMEYVKTWLSSQVADFLDTGI
jgi:hypothetical protein